MRGSLPVAPRARRPAHTPGRFAEHGVAQRGLPWLCGLHGDRGLRRWSGSARQPGLRVTYGGDVCRVAVVAVSPRLDRRCASLDRIRRGPHPGPGSTAPHPRRRRRGSSAGASAMWPPDVEPCGSSELAARERLATCRKERGMPLRASHRDELQSLPGIGPSLATDLRALGVRRVADLKWRDRSGFTRSSIGSAARARTRACSTPFAAPRTRPGPPGPGRSCSSGGTGKIPRCTEPRRSPHERGERPLHRHRPRRGDRVLHRASRLRGRDAAAPTFAMLRRGDLRLLLSVPSGRVAASHWLTADGPPPSGGGS